MNDTLLISIIALAAPLTFLAIVTWVLHYFVALKAPPTERAAWTVAVGYIVVAIMCASSLPDDAWAAPIAGIPAALLTFWFWRREFRQAWVNSDDDLLDGLALANDDWRAGLIFVVGLIGLAAIRVLMRLLTNGQV